MTTRFLTPFLLPLLLAVLPGCGNLEKEIDLDLPEYAPQYVVECYLEPGEPFRLSLSKSLPFFEPFPTDPTEFVSSILEDSAMVTVSHAGVDYPLQNGIDVAALFEKVKVYNYFSTEKVPIDYEQPFTLLVRTRSGDVITGSTRLLPPVPVDSVVVEFDLVRDTLARALTYITDDPDANNYYRRMYHIHSLDSIPDQDFVTNDDFVDDRILVFGSGYELKEGDTIYNTIFHIDRAYYDFWLSTFNAISSNGNPFGQPSGIQSNVTGAIGIFTALQYDRRMTVVEK